MPGPLTAEQSKWTAQFCELPDLSDPSTTTGQPEVSAASKAGAAPSGEIAAETGGSPPGGAPGASPGGPGHPVKGPLAKGAAPAPVSVKQFIDSNADLQKQLLIVARDILREKAARKVGEANGDYLRALDKVEADMHAADKKQQDKNELAISIVLTVALFAAGPAIAAVSKAISTALPEITESVGDTMISAATKAGVNMSRIKDRPTEAALWLVDHFDEAKAKGAIDAVLGASKQVAGKLMASVDENECVYLYIAELKKEASVARNKFQQHISGAATLEAAAAYYAALQDITPEYYEPQIKTQIEHFKRELAPVLAQLKRGHPDSAPRYDKFDPRLTTEKKIVKIMMHGEWRLAQISIMVQTTAFTRDEMISLDNWIDDDVAETAKGIEKIEEFDLHKINAGNIPPLPQHAKH